MAEPSALPPPVVFDPDDIREYGKIHPTLKELISLLDMQQKLPKVQADYLGDIYGSYKPYQNEINLNRKMLAPDLPPTITHEMSHALDEHMDDDFYDIHSKLLKYKDTTEEEKKFKEGYEKLLPEKTNFKRDPKRPYRYSNAELRSFGVERAAFPKNPSMTPIEPHVDFTMATEAAVLRDLYLRMLKSKK